MIIIIFLQFLIGQELEAVAGWLRVAIIYILSGIGGLTVCIPVKTIHYVCTQYLIVFIVHNYCGQSLFRYGKIYKK